MKILVVSDTHGQSRQIREVIEKTKPFDFLIHAGDTDGMEDDIREMAGCPCCIVRGNNDFYTDLPDEAVIELGGIRFWVTHGHRHGAGWDLGELRRGAKERECRIAVYGHTHRPSVDDTDPDVTLINPGSLAYPRQEGRLPSYIVIDIDRFGEPHFNVNYLGKKKKRRDYLW